VKRVLLTTTCIATVTEDWTFEVPDDFDEPEDWVEWLNDDDSPYNRFIDCKDVDVDDEHDREYRGHQYMEEGIL
jgi:hypothetical protein